MTLHEAILTPGCLLAVPGAPSAVLVWVERPGPVRVRLAAADGELRLALRDPDGREVAAGPDLACREAAAGLWEVTVEAPQPAGSSPVAFRLAVEGGFPCVIPGPGIVPSHFPTPEPGLRHAGPQFGGAREVELWVDVPAGLEMLTLQTWLPPGTMVQATPPGGEPFLVTFLPGAPIAYRSAELPVGAQPGCWRFAFAAPDRPWRFTTWEGLPLFFSRPPGRFPYAVLSCRACGPHEAPLDARFLLFHGAQRTALMDAAGSTPAVFYAPPGPVSLRVSRGMEYAPQTHAMRLAPGERREIIVTLERAMAAEPGWAGGDLHMHSYYEDGGQSPEKVALAGRANGLQYLFLTDEPDGILAAGLQQHNVPGRFLAQPGQELMTPDAHCNALNTRATIPCPAYGEQRATYPHPREWAEAVAAQAIPEGPTALMLNHPAHRPETAARHAYFRSWWVIDETPAVRLVENFDFASWFERLSQGRRLTGLWTTDSHDAALLPPGARRNYVYVGDELNERSLMEGLLSGRCFCSGHGGALLYLRVNGELPGSTVEAVAEGAATATVSCRSPRPIERVELVQDGVVTQVIPGHGALTLDAEARLAVRKAGWVLAWAYVTAEPEPPNGHTGTPLDLSGVAAFTNPVYLR
jgi:hypothetical protein